MCNLEKTWILSRLRQNFATSFLHRTLSVKTDGTSECSLEKDVEWILTPLSITKKALASGLDNLNKYVLLFKS